MTRSAIAGWTVATVLVVLIGLAAVVRYRTHHAGFPPAAAGSPASPASTPPFAEEGHPAPEVQGFQYGRITTVDGVTYEGRLRWGGGEEAFWSDYFNGFKDENPWVSQVLPEQLPKERSTIAIFGIKIADRESPRDLGRPFMARFGEIARIEAVRNRVLVTLKSGTVFDLDRFGASDFDDGVRVWDAGRGVVDLDSLRIRTVELLATPSLGAVPYRLHGTVRTQQGDFTGFVGWNRENYVGTDELDGHAGDGELSVRFDTIRSIARRSGDSSLVTLLDGREIVLSGTQEAGDDNRGTYVDDQRYGRVLISWDAFERVDFSDLSQVGSGPAYTDFPSGKPLAGSVTTFDGRRLAGRLVYDLDESETTDTLDAPSEGVDYTIPFGSIASIVRTGSEAHSTERAKVTLHTGEELQLEPTGDLGEGNGGLLIFVDGSERPEYVPWTDVGQIDFDRPPAILAPLGR